MKIIAKLSSWEKIGSDLVGLQSLLDFTLQCKVASHVTSETLESTFQVIKYELAPLLINKNPFNINKIPDDMNSRIYLALSTNFFKKEPPQIEFDELDK